MKYQHVCIESLGYALPDERVTSDEIESRLRPLYDRLKLPAGRLELMSGIRERRFWPPDTLPGDVSAITAEAALATAGIDRQKVGALVHASVCRDYLEPATACSVHHRLGLRDDCQVYDLSNACLGMLNGVLQLANMIELGQIEAGVVVGTESGRPLVERTIETLNTDSSLTREQMKLAVASLTIGSASAAMLVAHRSISRTGNRLLGGAARADTTMHHLCRGGHQTSQRGDTRPLMQTDSERLMEEGIALGKATFAEFLGEVGWRVDQVDKTFCHQIGGAHRKQMLKALGLNLAIDFLSFDSLGNTGSVALPVTMALGIEQGHLKPDDRVALLGIGSGINSVMLAIDWKVGLVGQAALAVGP